MSKVVGQRGRRMVVEVEGRHVVLSPDGPWTGRPGCGLTAVCGGLVVGAWTSRPGESYWAMLGRAAAEIMAWRPGPEHPRQPLPPTDERGRCRLCGIDHIIGPDHIGPLEPDTARVSWQFGGDRISLSVAPYVIGAPTYLREYGHGDVDLPRVLLAHGCDALAAERRRATLLTGDVSTRDGYIPSYAAAKFWDYRIQISPRLRADLERGASVPVA
jgi:hypothetical protein